MAAEVVSAGGSLISIIQEYDASRNMMHAAPPQEVFPCLCRLSDCSVLNLVIVKKGEQQLPGLTE